MRVAFVLFLVTWTGGCAPLFVPMMPKLSADDQRNVDQMWNNMLTPVQRVNRETLLDANLAFWMFEMGVDRLRMTSEKQFDGGTVIMEIDCDRINPDVDVFTVTIVDHHGKTLRRERYSRAEVEASSEALRGITNFGPAELREARAGENPNPADAPTTQPATARSETPEQRKRREETERRWRAVIAATQPATVESSPRPPR